MKHLHLLMVVFTLLLFAYSSFAIAKARPLGRGLQLVSHGVYTLLLISGAYLFYQLWQVAGMQYWALGKMLLLFAAIASLLLARKKVAWQYPLLALTWVLVLVILALAVAKPF